MKKRLFTLAALALAMTSVQASVVINSDNFPDENFLWEVENNWDSDQNGVLSDQEIAERDFVSLSGVTNFKGIEYFYHITTLLISGLNSDGNPVSNLDLTKFTKLERVEISEYPDITSLDFTKSPNLKSLLIATMSGLTTVQIPASIEFLYMWWNPKLTTVNLDACRVNLNELHLADVGIKDVDVSNFKNLHRIYIEGDGEERIYSLNSLNIAGCDNLWSISIQWTDIETVTIKDLPEFGEATVSDNDIRKLTVDNCPKLVFLDCQNNKLPELTIKKCEAFWRIFASDNYMQTLIIDESPALAEVVAENNQMMWLDLSNVVKDINVEDAPLRINNQHPSAVAYKLSPTEVGLKVHDRMNPARMKNLKVGGKSITATETAIDGIRYLVFYDDGVNVENVVGNKTTYEYETKWPYPWIDENSKDNNLPVALNITSWTKHQAFLTLSTNNVKGEYGKPAPAAPTVTRSEGYDGQITFSSGNESVVKVNPETGALTIVGPGTATIYVNGDATDYRLAPATQTYTVVIEVMLGDINVDGKVDVSDYIGIANRILGQTPEGFNEKAGDIDGNNVIDVSDYIGVANIILTGSPYGSRTFLP